MAYAAYLAGVPVRVGVSKEFGGSVLSHWLRAPADEQHQSDRALALLASVGVAPQGTHLHLDVPEQARAQATALRLETGLPERYAVLAPGASCPSRRWPAARFAEVAAAVARRCVEVVVVGDASDRAAAAAIVAHADDPRVTSLADAIGLPALVDLLTGIRDDGATVLVATHDPLVAARCGRVVTLRDGAVVDDVTRAPRPGPTTTTGPAPQ